MKKTIAVIGEGITEKFYIESLKGSSPFTILPRELGMRASNLRALESNIKFCIEKGYDEVYCLIDMDGKSEGGSKNQYQSLKSKYDEMTFSKKNKGIECKVFFIETERCTELWFLYYFTKGAVTRKFNSYEELERELKRYRPQYEKTGRYFRSIRNLHQHFESGNPAGSIISAFKNSKSSMESNIRDERGYSYSEMHKFIKAIGLYDDSEDDADS